MRAGICKLGVPAIFTAYESLRNQVNFHGQSYGRVLARREKMLQTLSVVLKNIMSEARVNSKG